MCGFVGYVTSNQNRFPDSIKLKNAIDSIHYRGPDHTGFWISKDNHIALAHKRLSILDLADRSNQPYTEKNTNFVIIFNGEIYNYLSLKEQLSSLGYLFETSSDTEVIYKGYSEWGTKVFSKLQGMFSIAIIDEDKDKIILARDIVGEKPLFYIKVEKLFCFASEIKPLLELEIVNKDIDNESLNYLFSKGYCPPTKSIFSQIRKLDASQFLEYSLKDDHVSINKYWDLEKKIIEKSKVNVTNEVYLLNKLETLLEESINLQLNADVPVGMLLSGGVDSSLLVALGSRAHNKLNTFNVSFRDHHEFDESKHARLIAEYFDCHHHEIESSSIDPSLFDQLSEYYDDPIFDTSMIPTFLLANAVSKYSKVAVGGDGGDELFGGYPHYNKFLKIHKKYTFIPHILRRRVSNFFQSLMPIGIKGKKTLEFIGNDFKNYYPNIAEFYNLDETKKIFNETINFSTQSKNLILNPIIPINNLITSSTYHDFSNYLKSDLLVKIDRASMANSLEIRSPFLDKKIIEFCFLEVPPYLKVDNDRRKILLKMLAAKILPKNFDFNRKKGFSIPINKFLNDPVWMDYFHQKVSDSDSNIFNKEYIFKLLRTSNAYRNNGERIAALIFFMCWVERFSPNFD